MERVTHRISGRDVEVRVGTRWVSRDPRDNGRTVEILALFDTPGGIRAEVRNVDTGRRGTVRLRAFGSRARSGFKPAREPLMAGGGPRLGR